MSLLLLVWTAGLFKGSFLTAQKTLNTQVRDIPPTVVLEEKGDRKKRSKDSARKMIQMILFAKWNRDIENKHVDTSGEQRGGRRKIVTKNTQVYT